MMTTDTMTKGDIYQSMKDAGYPMVWVPLAIAREIVSGERSSVWCEDLADRFYRGSGTDIPRTTAAYYADDLLVTAFDLSAVASNCQYSQASTYDASNLRSLTRDYANRVIDLRYMNGEVGLVLLASLDEDLCDVLTGLRDYPIYDEGDWSEYESELAEKAWDEYVRLDLTHTLMVALANEGIDVDVEDIVADEDLRELFYHSGYEFPEVWTSEDPATGIEYRSEDWQWIEYEGESGAPDSVIFPRMSEVTDRITGIIIDRARARNTPEA